jgi:hypothetical protein
MKNTIRNLGGVALVGVATLIANPLRAQTAVETTTLGTISEFSPETIQIRTEAATAPVAYRYTKSTAYVDETGAPVSIETVKSGLPVTVYYTKSADGLIASRVVVRKTVSTVPVTPAVEETKTTTTTTTEQ